MPLSHPSCSLSPVCEHKLYASEQKRLPRASRNNRLQHVNALRVWEPLHGALLVSFGWTTPCPELDRLVAHAASRCSDCNDCTGTNLRFGCPSIVNRRLACGDNVSRSIAYTVQCQAHSPQRGHQAHRLRTMLHLPQFRHLSAYGCVRSLAQSTQRAPQCVQGGGCGSHTSSGSQEHGEVLVICGCWGQCAAFKGITADSRWEHAAAGPSSQSTCFRLAGGQGPRELNNATSDITGMPGCQPCPALVSLG